MTPKNKKRVERAAIAKESLPSLRRHLSEALLTMDYDAVLTCRRAVDAAEKLIKSLPSNLDLLANLKQRVVVPILDLTVDELAELDAAILSAASGTALAL